MTIWQNILLTVFAGIGGSAMILAIVAWLVKTTITAWIARDAEAFKTRLKANGDIEIEKLKNSLGMVAIEHEVRFSKMHEKRGEVIEALYKKLTHVFWHGQRFVLTSENNPSDYQKEEFAKMRNELTETFTFIEEHRIYLPESVCALVDKHLGQVRRTVFAAGVYGRIENPNERTYQQSNDAFEKAYANFETDIPAARKTLETAFRQMIGVEPS